MKENKPKIKRIKEPRVKKSSGSLLFTGLSLILTIAMFIGLIFLQDYLSEKITYKQVVVAKKDIPDNEIITEENLEKYFTVKSINILDTTAGALADANTLLGKKAIIPLYEGEAVSEKDFENISAYTEGIENPVEVSVKITDIADADGGKIRKGDLVNLTMMFTKAQLGITSGNGSVNSLNVPISSENDSDLFDTFNSEESENESTDNVVNQENAFSDSAEKTDYAYEAFSQYVLENLYVEKVLDSSGIEIAPTDTESSAGIIVFTIEKENEVELNNALANCTFLRISKIINE